MSKHSKLDGLNNWYDYLSGAKDMEQVHLPAIRVCCGGGCMASGAAKVFETLKAEAKARALPVRIVRTGCLGPCAKGPVVSFDGGKAVKGQKTSTAGNQSAQVFYGLNVERAKELIAEWDVNEAEPISRSHHLRWDDAQSFYENQRKVALRSCGIVDPERIESAVANGAYAALIKLLFEWNAEAGGDRVLQELEASGLRGRGGAGFPTHFKWRAAREQAAKPKYVVCNADEGDPGAFMDRSIIEGAPHDLIEGMLLAGITTGAEQGYVYVRAEYPLAVERLERAIGQALALGLLGQNILGTGINFELEIRKGSGAFVCGEETALMHSIEGKRGEPRPRPPFPAEKGLWGCPSLLNNVETYASVACIVGMGAKEYLQFVHGPAGPEG
ncbi:MAG: hydrogenase, partial [Spirochaetaceae bacterium]